MWFSKTETIQKSTSPDASKVLSGILSDGIHLSINELIQYQNKSALINLTPRKNVHGHLSGNYLARSKGRGMEFDEVRHYQTGDDIRAIDWRVTARTGKTHTKLFREEVERPVLIATDLTSSMIFGSQLLFKSVQAAHVAALVAWHAKSRGDRVGGIVFNQVQHQELKPRSRQHGVLHYLHALKQINNSGVNLVKQNKSQNQEVLKHKTAHKTTHKTEHKKDHQAYNPAFEPNIETIAFEQNCARIRHLAKPGSLVYLITDANNINPEALRHLTHISRHCELIICLISDPLEHQLPASKQRLNVAVTDGVNRQQLTLGDKKTASDYLQLSRQLTKEKEDLLSKAGARLLNFCASKSLENQLKNGVSTWTR
ncbi:MAG: DUF58 domain-containing protein [Alteromonadaceae bacterium]|nr:DUF58 domain-containing protein [Alteromonadaceae bacterium]